MIERFLRRKQLDRIEHRLGVVQTLVEDDLNAAVAALTTAVTSAVDEIKTETQNILDARAPTGRLATVAPLAPPRS